MGNNPLVSAILPTYNWQHHWLTESIDSVISQTYSNRELIIINDASTNDIEKTILAYVAKDPRIKYFNNEHNLKLTKTLNKWIEFSQWEYIARIDDDDVWCDKDKLQKQVDYMNNNPSCWVIWTHAYVIDHHGNNIWSIKHSTQSWAIRKYMLFTNQFVHSSVLVRKSALENVWLYDPDRNYIEDYELRLRIWSKYDFANIDTYCVLYRKSEASITSQKNMKQHKMILKLIDIYKNSYPYWVYAKTLRIWIIGIMYLLWLFGKYRLK
jgi:glycosyltransferase involved in cell wall biosynthesis